MNQQSPAQEPLVLSYLSLRKAVGIIGVALPFALTLGKILSGHPGFEASISDYYYTDTRNILVGSLCAIGVFLLSTKGYDGKDQIAGILASLFSVGVAFFPTTPDGKPLTPVGILHYAFAALLFLTFAYFCLKLFTKTSGNMTPQKIKRNRIYRTSGVTILICIALIAVTLLPPITKHVEQLKPKLWLEWLSILAFGLAWLTKGEAILKDEDSSVRQNAAQSASR